VQTLSGTWKLALDEKNVGREEKWFERIGSKVADARVPGIIQEVFPDKHGIVWYWREFQPDQKIKPHERYLLKFGAVDYLADVWVNGEHIGGHEGGETPFTLDVTAVIRYGKSNLLAVRVHNPTYDAIDGIKLLQTPHFNKAMAWEYAPGKSYNYGGIIAPVELLVVPAVRLTDVFARPNVKTGEIRTAITVFNDTAKTVKGTLTGFAGLAAGGEVLSTAETKSTFPAGESTHEIVLKIAQPRLWNLDDPNLYRVTVKFDSQDQLYRHETMVRCGFREFKVERGYFRLNGKRIFLKSTHTGNHYPIGQIVPVDPDLVRRDMLMAKVAGYNCVRFIASMGSPEQMDFADEIGLMVYEECKAGWCLEDSPEMKRRFNDSVREMILRDRNHPSITIWGLLNETEAGNVFQAAVDSLSWIRDLDDTRLVLLSSGRWDNRPDIGSVSNPGSKTWELMWGAEGVSKKPEINTRGPGGYFTNPGDVHIYPPVPLSLETLDTFKNLARGLRPVFLSESGVGSMLDVVRGCRWFEQFKARPDLSDATLFRTMAERLESDWKKWGFQNTYAFLGDLLRDSQKLHSRQRRLVFDMVRGNPNLCGYNLTGMLDHAITGEGVWTFWREWKPESAETLADGWAPLRWCLFIDTLNGYSGRTFKLRAVLANEDVLGPGEYPCTFKVHGKTGTIWEKKVTLKIPKVKPNQDNPLAYEMLCEDVKLKGPAGEYEFLAYMKKGGAPFGGRRNFYMAEPVKAIKNQPAVTLFGVEPTVEKWLTRQGIKCTQLGKSPSKKQEVILVGNSEKIGNDSAGWQELARRVARGSYAIFTSPKAFTKKTKPIGHIEHVGTFWTSDRKFEVPNVPKEEWSVYNKEYYGPIHFVVGKLSQGEYDVKLDFCEGCVTQEKARIFSCEINSQTVLKDFDIVKEAGGFQRAVSRTFKVRAKDGKIEISFYASVNAPSLCRLSVYNAKGKLVAQDMASRIAGGILNWLPLEEKGRVVDFWDWLYHKECVAKDHPIFAGLQGKGIMDWDYYGPVISNKYYEYKKEPSQVFSAAFATGYCCPGGYVSGIMMAEYPFGKGRFLLNIFNIIDNIDKHPAADRLLLNMINHAAGFCKGAVKPLPKNFQATLKAIGYVD